MPERQASSGEVTTRPDPGRGTADDEGSADANGATVPNGTAVPHGTTMSNGAAAPLGDTDPTIEPVSDRTTEQRVVGPAAADPSPAPPGDAAVGGDAAGEATVETAAAGHGAGGAAAAGGVEEDTAEVAAAPTAPAPTAPVPTAATPTTATPTTATPTTATPTAPVPTAPVPTAPVPTAPVPTAPAPTAPAPTAATDPDTATDLDTAAGPDTADQPRAANPADPRTAPAARGPVPPRPRSAPEPGADAGSDDAAPTVAVPVTGPGADDESPTVTVRRAADRGKPWFVAPDAEATQALPSGPTAAPADPPTERLQLPPRTPADPAPDETVAVAVPPTAGPPESAPPRGAKRRLLVVAGAVAVLGLAYGADVLLSSGSVPRGTTVAGVSVGGLSLADAEQTLRTQIEPRTTQPVAVTVGEARSQLDPRVAGLAVDWSATLDRAGAQPLNPITRVTSFFTSHEVGVATSTDRAALDAALAQLAPIVDKAPAEGTVKFDGVTPVPVDPVPGQQLDGPGAATVLERDWAGGGTVALPLTTLPAITTPDDVAAAIAKVAKPAVAAPVTVLGENGAQATLKPEVIASALTFRADPSGLVPAINNGALTDALKPQLAASEKPGRDAKLDFTSGTPVVVPSQDGRGIDYPATLKDLLPVLTGTGKREITAVYADQPAKLTTEQLTALGISGVIGEFQTGGFASDSGRNIRRAAEQINGVIVQPGETFSLNGVTNPRDAAHGYVEAGIIENGRAARGVGGGVSQVATTLYNASYFAGMTNVEHKEHSFYISRYPAGREATVFDDIIDLKFRNDNPTAVMIQTTWTPSSLNIKIYGTKVWEVSSASGPRTNPTSPNTITIPAGEQCSPSKGAPGFTITNTRTLKNVQTGEVRTDPTRTVKYNPSPIVICGG